MNMVYNMCGSVMSKVYEELYPIVMAYQQLEKGWKGDC